MLCGFGVSSVWGVLVEGELKILGDRPPFCLAIFKHGLIHFTAEATGMKTWRHISLIATE